MIFDDLEYRRGEIARHQENSARLAEEYHRFTSTGQGSMEFADCAQFDITMIEEPFMRYGCEIDLDAWADLLDLDPGITPPLPVCTGFVTDWDMDDRGFYLGAYLAVSVYFPGTGIPVPVDAQPTITHHFTFTAIGIKDVPLDVRD